MKIETELPAIKIEAELHAIKTEFWLLQTEFTNLVCKNENCYGLDGVHIPSIINLVCKDVNNDLQHIINTVSHTAVYDMDDLDMLIIIAMMYSLHEDYKNLGGYCGGYAPEQLL